MWCSKSSRRLREERRGEGCEEIVQGGPLFIGSRGDRGAWGRSMVTTGARGHAGPGEWARRVGDIEAGVTVLVEQQEGVGTGR